jgi:hypothetical protein
MSPQQARTAEKAKAAQLKAEEAVRRILSERRSGNFYGKVILTFSFQGGTINALHAGNEVFVPVKVDSD